MDLNTLYHRTVESWADRVNAVGRRPVGRPTPCRSGPSRDLVNHVVGEDLLDRAPRARAARSPRWATASTATCWATTRQAALDAAMEATEAVARRAAGGRHRPPVVRRGAAGRVRATSSPPTTSSTRWDLAVATGGDTRLDPHLVTEVATWFAEREDALPGAGAIGPRGVSHGGRPGRPARGLRSGRRTGVRTTRAWRAFSAAFGSGDVDAIMATDDRRLRLRGHRAGAGRRTARGRGGRPRAVWVELFGQTRDARFTEEDVFVAGDRAVLRWRFDWAGDDGAPGTSAASTCCGSGTGRSARSCPTSRAERAACSPRTGCVWMVGMSSSDSIDAPTDTPAAAASIPSRRGRPRDRGGRRRGRPNRLRCPRDSSR